MVEKWPAIAVRRSRWVQGRVISSTCAPAVGEGPGSGAGVDLDLRMDVVLAKPRTQGDMRSGHVLVRGGQGQFGADRGVVAGVGSGQDVLEGDDVVHGAGHGAVAPVVVGCEHAEAGLAAVRGLEADGSGEGVDQRFDLLRTCDDGPHELDR